MSGPAVHKTYKLYVGGRFPRSESGRSLPAEDPRGRGVLAHVCRASRKDLRDAVEAALAAWPAWAGARPMLRGQILYRLAEMVAARRREFADLERRFLGTAPKTAEAEVDEAVRRLLWYAGWADKIAQVLGTVNPVSGPWFNFSFPEPTGTVWILPPERPGLLPLVSMLAPVLVSGNTAVTVSGSQAAPAALTLAEAAATADLPGGVWNALSGLRDELAPHAAAHRGFQAAFVAADDEELVRFVEAEAADHIKRVLSVPAGPRPFWRGKKSLQLEWIRAFVEIKTAWHPIGW